MGVEVLVIQHGEKVRSAGDPGLTEEGHRQAQTVATWLAGTRSDIEAVIVSPLRGPARQPSRSPLLLASGSRPTLGSGSA